MWTIRFNWLAINNYWLHSHKFSSSFPSANFRMFFYTFYWNVMQIRLIQKICGTDLIMYCQQEKNRTSPQISHLIYQKQTICNIVTSFNDSALLVIHFILISNALNGIELIYWISLFNLIDHKSSKYTLSHRLYKFRPVDVAINSIDRNVDIDSIHSDLH